MSTEKTSLKLGGFKYPVVHVKIPDYLGEKIDPHSLMGRYSGDVADNCGSTMIINPYLIATRKRTSYGPKQQICIDNKHPLVRDLFLVSVAKRFSRVGLPTFPVSQMYLSAGREAPENATPNKNSRVTKPQGIRLDGGQMRSFMRRHWGNTVFVLDGGGLKDILVAVLNTPPTINGNYSGRAIRGEKERIYTSVMTLHVAEAPRKICK